MTSEELQVQQKRKLQRKQEGTVPARTRAPLLGPWPTSSRPSSFAPAKPPAMRAGVGPG